ncbi:MAG TPA: glycosyltransferase [bacterium]|nr:glycosyltransferase [bacterium]
MTTEKNSFVLHALLACYNRREKTLKCLKSFRDQAEWRNAVEKRVTLFDDGSSDGTASSVMSEKLADEIITGDGNYFWCGAMRKLWVEYKGGDDDLILLLNDDVVLDPSAVKDLLNTWEWSLKKNPTEPIIVGAIQSNDRTTTTYGGMIKTSRFRPLALKIIGPSGQPLPCDTFNCNCVLISKKTMDSLNGFDEKFTHNMGDIDLGLRAMGKKIPIWLTPGYVGCCDENVTNSKKKSFGERWKAIKHPKGSPVSETLYFYKQHSRFLWPLFWVTYLTKRFLYLVLG